MYCCHNCDRLYYETEPSTVWVNTLYPHEQSIEICPYCGARVDNLLWGEETIGEDELMELLEGVRLSDLKKLLVEMKHERRY